DAQMDIVAGEHGADFAAALAGEGNDGHFAVVRGLDGLDDVVGIAAGGNGHQDVARLAQRVDLALENGVEAVVVADRRKNGGVGVQGNAGKGQAVAFEAAHQFGDEVLRIGGAAAVAAGKNLVVIGQCRKHQLYGHGQRFGKFACAGFEGVDAIVKVRGQVCGHVHSGDYLIFRFR